MSLSLRAALVNAAGRLHPYRSRITCEEGGMLMAGVRDPNGANEGLRQLLKS